MKKYVFNPEYSICQNDEIDVILTSNMEDVFVLQNVESIVVRCFLVPQTIKEAIMMIRNYFVVDSFNELECENFISEMIDSHIIVLADDKT